MSNFEITLFASSGLLIFLITGLIHFSTKMGMLSINLGRKILHVAAILVCGYVIANTQERTTLAWIFFACAIFLVYIIRKNILLPNTSRSLGIALFPIAFGVLLLSPLNTSAVLFAVFTLGISDAMAGLIGQKWANRKVRFLVEDKSWLGFGAFYISTFCIGYAFVGLVPELVLLALVPALTELFSYKGSDNFTVPLVAAGWFAFFQHHEFLIQDAWVLLVLPVFGFFVIRKKWLTEAGATAAALLAVLISTLCGPLYLLPLLVFFAAGSLASKLHSKPKEVSGRDAFQVFSNGLVPTLCLCAFAITGAQVYAIAYFASVCINLTDTISSDIGTYFRQKTYDILTFRPTPVGISGGVSVAGTLAGMFAAFAFAVLMKLVFLLTISHTTLVALIGIAGMILDSVLGSKFQAKYLLNGEEIELALDGARLVKGWPWLQNDLVNLISNALLILGCLAGSLL